MIRTLLSAALLNLMASLALDAQTMDNLFDDSALHEIRIETHPSDWRRLREDYLDNTYYPANFEWRGVAVEEVGIRLRGNGSRSSAKPGLKIDFNKFHPQGQFLGLKSLVLDNLTQDPSMMRELLAMKVFRAMGLAAPRVAYAKLWVNGAYSGLYTVVEPVDTGFLKRNLGEDTGYLYDYEWESEYWFEDLGDDPSSYTPNPFQLKTNENAPDPKPLVDLIRIVNQSSDAQFVQALSARLDPRHFVTYLAVEAFLAEADGVAGNWGMNNFYLYGSRNTGRFSFIPWDKDLTFFDADRSIWLNLDRNVLTRRLLAVPEMKQYFLEQVRRCEEIAGERLEQEIEAHYQLVSRAAADDPSKPYTYGQFEEGVASLRRFAFDRGRVVANATVE